MVTPAGSADDIHTLSCPSAHFCIATGSELLTSTDPAGGASAWYSTSGVINDDAEAVTCHEPAPVHRLRCRPRPGYLCLSHRRVGRLGLHLFGPERPGNTMGIGLSCPAVDLCVVTGDNDILTSTSPSAGAPAAPTTPTTIPAATTSPQRSIRLAGGRQISQAKRTGSSQSSCPSPGLCVAVDNGGKAFVSTDPSGGSTSAWKMSAVAGASSGFAGVSCPDIELCVGIAGGNILTTTDPTGGGAKWKSLDAGNALMGQGGDEFVSVSCPSPTLCLVADINGNVLVSTNPTGPASAWKVSDVDAAAASPEVTSLSCPSVHFLRCRRRRRPHPHHHRPDRGRRRPGKWRHRPGRAAVSPACPARAPASVLLRAASCSSPLTHAGGGTAWKEVSGVLNGDAETVACASSTVCVASDVALDLATSSNPTGGAAAWTSSYVPP